MDTNLDNLIEDLREEAINPVSERLEAIYAQASEDMEKKLADYLSAFERRDSEMLDLLDAGDITKSEYKQWRANNMIYSRDWKFLREELAEIATDADLLSAFYINESLPSLYAEFWNLTHYVAEVQNGVELGYNFSLYNENTVKKLVKEEAVTLPYSHPDANKTLHWNTQHVNSVVAKGVLSGDSIPKIAKSMRDVCGMDYRSSMRSARTAHNSAQNQANYDACSSINEHGIPMVIEWSSARDRRVRDTHILLEGKTVKVGEKFSNGLRFPLDVQYGFDKPWEIYNCRCKGLTFLASIDHSKDIEAYDKWMQENYYDDWRRKKFVDGDVTGDIRDTWKGENPNVLQYQAEALTKKYKTVEQIDGAIEEINSQIIKFFNGEISYKEAKLYQKQYEILEDKKKAIIAKQEAKEQAKIAKQETKKKEKEIKKVDIKSDGAPKVIDANNAIQYFNDNLNYEEFWKNLSPELSDALNTYTGSAYERINRYLRGVNDTISYRLKEVISNIDEAIEQAPALVEDIQVFRYTDADVFPSDLNSMLGNCFVDMGFMSTSVSNRASSGFGDVRMEITIPAGSRAGIYVEEISMFRNEKEFLLARGATIRITEVIGGYEPVLRGVLEI